MLQVFDFQGSLLGSGVLSNNWPADHLAKTSSMSPRIDWWWKNATDLHYNILTTNADTKMGTEMIGWSARPCITRPCLMSMGEEISRTRPTTKGITSASNTYNNLSRSVVANTLAVNNTLESLLLRY